MAFDVEQYLSDLTPQRADLSEVYVSDNELEVVNFAEGLFNEGKAWQKSLGLEAIFTNALDALATKHFIQKKDRDYRIQVAVNLFRKIIEQKLAQLTDTAPIFEVSSRSGNDWAADISEDVMGSLWEEYSGQTFLDRVALQAMIGGSSPAFATWDPTLDSWSGDIRMQVFPTRQVVVDPYLDEARLLQSNAMFVGVEIVRPLSEFRLHYGDRGRRVKATSEFSHFGMSANTDYTVGYGKPYKRVANRGTELQSSSIPRAVERRIYFRDLSIHPTEPTRPDGTPNLLFPRKRCIAWSAQDKVLLTDGDGMNWDGKFPLEIFDWGMNLEHSYGESEYEALWSIQRAINMLLSGLTHNARLQNEPPWMAEENSIDPVELDHWEDYSDRPGQFHFFKPGHSAPQPLPPAQFTGPVVVQTLQMLMSGMELVGGVPPVSRGQTEDGVTSGKAIDSLQQAAGATIRRASRRLEDFLSRYGQLLLSRVIQYFPDERIFYLTKNAHFSEVMAMRDAFLQSIVQARTEAEMEQQLLYAQRDLRLRVKPESGLGMAVAQKVMFMERQAAAGRVSDVEVLRAARVSDPEEKVAEAEQNQLRKAMQMGQIRAILGGAGPQQQGQKPPGQNGARSVPRQDQRVLPPGGRA